ANEYIAEKAPWSLAKEEGRENDVLEICSLGVNCFRLLMTWLKPVLPATAVAAEEFLNKELTWSSTSKWLGDHKINNFKPLMTRVEAEKVQAMVDASKEETNTNNGASDEPKNASSWLGKEPLAAEIEYDDFAKVDLRVARI